MIQDDYFDVTIRSLENALLKNDFIEKNASILVDKDCKKSKALKQVVFATDFSENSFKTYLNVLNIAKTENFVINFLHVSSKDRSDLFTRTFKTTLKRFTQICPVANVGIIWETTAANIARGIEEVVDKFGGELVVVACNNNSSINLRRHYLENFTEVKSQLHI